MLKNYLKTSLRFLKQNKLFAGINIFGLSIALAASFIILLYVINEMSYDHCHKNRKRVYRVLSYDPGIKNTMAIEPYILGTTIKEKFPQIEKVISIMPLPITFKTVNGLISETSISADPGIFDIFTLPMVGGSPGTNLLEDKNSIVISLDLAKKLFGSQSAVGKTIVAVTFEGDHSFTVSGVFANIPENSTFRAQCIINSRWSVDYINKKLYKPNAETNWDQSFWDTWVLLSKECDVRTLTIQINTFIAKKIGGHPANTYSFQNLSDVYLRSEKMGGSDIHGNLGSVRIFSAIALLVIVVAAINYIILSTAISTGRTKEIGIRKTFGAGVERIKNQFLSESLVLVSFALPVALLLMWLILPLAGRLFQTQLHIMKSNIIVYILAYFLLVITIGVVSGFYTSSYLSRLNVLDILSNVTHSGTGKYYFRSFLIVIQLIIFCSAISCALIIRSQYKYAINKDPGYNNKDILLIYLGEDFKGYQAFLDVIKSHQDVIMAAGTGAGLPMTGVSAALQIPNYENKAIQVMVSIMNVDFNFFKTMGISVIEGRDFSEEYGIDTGHSIILNEKAIKQLSITDPLKNKYMGSPIVGVVKDFNLFSVHSEIPPISIYRSNGNMRQIIVHYKPGKPGSILPYLRTEWKKIAPDRPFRHATIEEVIENLYTSERNLSTIVSIFALLSIVISAFGLFGLTLFVARSRTREIGIKKIFGSSENAIVFTFLRENFILVSIAVIISIPVTIHYMLQWLNQFAFKTGIGWWVFVLAYLSSAVVVLLTVLYHSVKVAKTNPVKALRYE